MNAPRRRQAGLTLIEMMIALTLGLLLIAGVISLFVSTHKSNSQNDQLAGMQDQARFALATLARDVTMAGYWGGMPNVTLIVPDLSTGSVSSATQALPTANDCGATASTPWAYVLFQTVNNVPISKRIEFTDNTTTAAAATAIYNCMGSQVAGSDIVAIRRVAGQMTTFSSASSTTATAATAKARVNEFYLKTNGVVGTMVRCASATCDGGGNATEAPLQAPQSFYKYVPRIYFIRSFSHAVGDGIPALCRKEFCQSGFTANANPELSTCGGTTSTAGMYTECLADGVEDMQIVWGVNRSSNGGIVDTYTNSPAVGELGGIPLTAQISVRVRSAVSDPSYTDPKTYTMGNAPAFTPSTYVDPTGTTEAMKAKHFFRRIYTTTVTVRNPQ